MLLNDLERRCVDLSYKHHLSHLSSVLGAVNKIDEIYSKRLPIDPFILGNGHAALALYVVLESRGYCVAEEMIGKHGTHASRDINNGIWVTGGSLGQPETIAVGMAYGDRSRNVYIMTSDGALAEGSIWESLEIATALQLKNLKLTVIANGFSAYSKVEGDRLKSKLGAFFPSEQTDFYVPRVWPFHWLQGLKGHYVVMNESQYREITEA